MGELDLMETQGERPENREPERQVNFRAPESMADWIRNRSKEQNQRQEVFLRSVVEQYMLKVKGEEFPTRGVETAEFVSHLTALQRMFVSSLDLWQHTEERVREEFRLQLETKDRAIADYQEQVTALKEDKKVLAEDAAKAKALQAELDTVAEQARTDRNNAADRLAEKDRLISALDSEVLKYKAQAEGYDDLKAGRDALAEQLHKANSTIKDLQKDHQMEMERAGMAAQQAQREAVVEATSTIKEKLDQVKEQLAAAQAEANSLREFKVANDNLREIVGAQKAKITMLEEQVAAMDQKANNAESEATEWREKSLKQAEQIRILQAQIQEMKASRNAGADGQTAIEGV